MEMPKPETPQLYQQHWERISGCKMGTITEIPMGKLIFRSGGHKKVELKLRQIIHPPPRSGLF